MPRTHDDSWDLASSVGATATMVATSRAMASRGSEPLLDDPFAEPLVRDPPLAGERERIRVGVEEAVGEDALADARVPERPRIAEEVRPPAGEEQYPEA